MVSACGGPGMRVCEPPLEKGGRLASMFVDIKRAHLNRKVPDGERAYIELPEGVGRPSM